MSSSSRAFVPILSMIGVAELVPIPQPPSRVMIENHDHGFPTSYIGHDEYDGIVSFGFEVTSDVMVGFSLSTLLYVVIAFDSLGSAFRGACP
jgi:hypothetical protein